MPDVTITQLHPETGEDSESSSSELMFLAEGSSDWADVIAAIPGSIPDIYEGLVRQGIRREDLGGGYWYLYANYSAAGQASPPPPLQYGDPERVSWDTTGGTTVRRTHAPLIYTYAGPAAAVGSPNNGDAINVTDDGVEGIEVEVGSGIFTIETVITSAQATTSYGRRLLSWSKRYTNNAEWRGFAAGEVRFLGGRMTERADGYWDLVRTFEVAENVTGQSFAGVTGIDKKGHEYVWAQIVRVEDTTNKAVVPATIAVYVHEVYPGRDFGLLEP